MKTTSTSNLLAALVLGLSTATTFAAFSGSDDFNDNSKDLSKWGTDIITGSTALTETNLRLEYTTSGTSSNETALRPWIANSGSSTSDWTLQIDVNLPTRTLATNQSYLFGLVVRNGDDSSDIFGSALELANFTGTERRFLSFFHVDGVNQGEVKSVTASTSAAVRIRYAATGTTLFAEFDADGAAGGYNFTTFDSRNIASWNMTAASVFAGNAAGASEGNLVITSTDNVAGDNFQAVVPEPSSAILFLSGAALCLRRRSLRTHERSA